MSQSPYGDQPNHAPGGWQGNTEHPLDARSEYAQQPPYDLPQYTQPPADPAQPGFFQPGWDQPGFGQPAGRPPHSSPLDVPSPYAQAPEPAQQGWPSSGQPAPWLPSNGQPPHAQAPYAQAPHGYAPYGQPGYPQSPYGQPQSGQLRPLNGYGQAPYQPPVGRKEPGISLLVSFFVPGVGTIINGETGKGVGILIGYFVCALLVWLIIPIAGMLALWIWGMVDAYQGAQRFNIAHGLMP